MVTQVSGNNQQLKILMHFFNTMFEIAKPFTDPKTKKINAPGGRLPINNLDTRVVRVINEIDNVFIETMRDSEWITVFSDGYKKCKEKLAESGSGLRKRLH